MAIILTKKVMHYSAHVIDWNDITMSVPGTTCRYQVPGMKYHVHVYNTYMSDCGIISYHTGISHEYSNFFNVKCGVGAGGGGG